MMNTTHEPSDRINDELRRLERLREGSSILDFHVLHGAGLQGAGLQGAGSLGTGLLGTGLQGTGSQGPSCRIEFVFRGKGMVTGPVASAEVPFVSDEVEVAETHRIEVVIEQAFPDSPPSIRWITGIVHPNVGFDGRCRLADIGLGWQPAMTLDVICDRLWDVTRLAYLNRDAEKQSKRQAAIMRWLLGETSDGSGDGCEHALPIDRRPLKDRSLKQPQNVVSYRRLGSRRRLSDSRANSNRRFADRSAVNHVPKSTQEVVYITDDEPDHGEQPAAGSGRSKRSGSGESSAEDGIRFVN